jgi:hypothetical protein
MRPLPLLVAAALVAALVLTPIVSAAGSITYSSPAAGASYTGTASYSISGAVSPIPSQPDNVFITVKSPNGATVDAASVSVALSTGTFTYATATGGNSNWVSGTYTISATDSFGATGSTTFSYTGATPAPTVNDTKYLVDIENNQTIIEHNQAEILGNISSVSSSLAALSGAVSTLSGTVNTINSAVTALTTAVGTISTDVTNIMSTVNTISTNVNNLSSLGSQLSSATGTISTTQTYVLVVAVLAAITLVLELAILVRKLS